MGGIVDNHNFIIYIYIYMYMYIYTQAFSSSFRLVMLCRETK